MAKRQRIWIRIGTQKTGNSAMQAWFSSRAADLAQEGLVYLKPDPQRHAAGSLATTLAADQNADKSLDQLRAALATDAEDFFLSSENFGLYPAARFRPLLDLFKDMDLRILVWLRRQDMYAEALLKQTIKWNGAKAGDPQHILTRSILPMLDYGRLLNDWEETYPDATILPQIYPEQAPSGRLPDSIADTLAVLGYGHLTPRASQLHRSNVSPNAALVQHYQSIPDQDRLRTANRSLMKQNWQSFAGRGDLLTDAQRDMIAKAVAEPNKRLRDKWFPDRPTLFDDAMSPGTDSGDEATKAFDAIYRSL